MKKVFMIMMFLLMTFAGTSTSTNAVADEGHPCRCHWGDDSCEAGALISFRAKCFCSYSSCVTYPI